MYIYIIRTHRRDSARIDWQPHDPLGSASKRLIDIEAERVRKKGDEDDMELYRCANAAKCVYVFILLGGS